VTLALRPFLAALQVADSAFPCGRYALSHGLESFVQSGEVSAGSGARGLSSLLADQLEHGIATADGVALAWAHRAVRAGAGPARLDERLALDADLRLSAAKLAREAREASARTGRGVLDTVLGSFAGPALTAYARLVCDGAAPGNGAVVTGILAAELAVPVEHAVAAELYAFAAGWLNAAVRLGVTEHRTAQAVLYRCGPVTDRAARRACRTGLRDLSSCTALADVMGMRHEQATLRLFMS
jgi:urease accessory protein